MKRVCCAALLLVFGSIGEAVGDPIEILPGSGYYTTVSREPDGTFSSSGTLILGDLVTGVSGRELFAGARAGCQNCAPGDLLNLSASFELRGPRYMSAGDTYAVWGQGVLNFTSPTVTIPSKFLDLPPQFPLWIYAPFTFSGHIELFRNTDNARLFGGDVSGAGTTRTLLFGNGREWHFEQQLWDFGPESGHAPVPEPASMILLGAGLVGSAGSVLRKRHNHEGANTRLL